MKSHMHDNAAAVLIGAYWSMPGSPAHNIQSRQRRSRRPCPAGEAGSLKALYVSKSSWLTYLARMDRASATEVLATHLNSGLNEMRAAEERGEMDRGKRISRGAKNWCTSRLSTPCESQSTAAAKYFVDLGAYSHEPLPRWCQNAMSWPEHHHSILRTRGSHRVALQN